jgi:hypothetical protein
MDAVSCQASITLVTDKCDISVEYWWNDNDGGYPKYEEKETCPNTTLSIANPTWTGLESNPGLQGEKPATNYLCTAPT